MNQKGQAHEPNRGGKRVICSVCANYLTLADAHAMTANGLCGSCSQALAKIKRDRLKESEPDEV